MWEYNQPSWWWTGRIPEPESVRPFRFPEDLNEKVEPAISKQEIDDFQTDCLVNKQCTQRLADYLVNSENFTLDECLNEAY